MGIFPILRTMRLLHATNLCTDKCVDTLMNHGNPVDGRNPAPVEGKVVFSHYLQGFSTIQTVLGLGFQPSTSYQLTTVWPGLGSGAWKSLPFARVTSRFYQRIQISCLLIKFRWKCKIKLNSKSGASRSWRFKAFLTLVETINQGVFSEKSSEISDLKVWQQELTRMFREIRPKKNMNQFWS